MTKREPDPIKIQLTLGILGFLGVLLTVLATIFGPIIQENLRQRNQPTQTPIVIVESSTPALVIPTDTVPPGDPTSTPAPATDTPVPTFTTIPPVPLGQDWRAGCISSLWRPFPASIQVVERDGCLLEPVHVFSANDGRLSFLGNRSANGGEERFGLFTLLPESGTITVHVRLRDLTNVDLWMGVFASPDDLTSQGMLMTIPAGNVRNRLIVQKDVSNYETIQTTQMISQDDGFIISFEFNPLSVRSLVNRNLLVTNPVSIPSTQKWFFIGYKGLSGNYRIEGEFFDFELR
jgi:hypothetical protein